MPRIHCKMETHAATALLQGMHIPASKGLAKHGFLSNYQVRHQNPAF